MTQQTTAALQHTYAKLAGLSYILFTLTGFTNSFLLNGKLSDISELAVTGLFENEMHFRLGIAAEIIMFLAVIMASVSFYVVLKPVNKQLAQTALCLRLVEVIVGGFAVVASMTMLAISSKAYLLDLFSLEQMRTIMVLAASFRVPAYEYSWISMGFAGVITFYLFFRAHYIPKAWAIWGMITYTSLILYPMAKLLVADLPREAMFVMFPGALFELGVGIWLVTKGIKLPSTLEKTA